MILRNAYYNTTRKNSQHLLSYLERLGGKTLKCRRTYVFKLRWKDIEVNLRDRCQVQSSCEYLQHILEGQNINERSDDIKVLIAEVIPIIKRLDSKIDTSFVLISTNTRPSAIHYGYAESLFHHNKLPKYASRRYDLDLLVLYTLRLALEKRILGFLGIDYITANGKPLGFSRLFPIVKSLENINYSEDVKWDEIKLVNKWLNHYMHRHIRPYPWGIYEAFQVLNPLLKKSKLKTDTKTIGSLYASTSTYNYQLLREEIEERIIKEIPKAVISWSDETEILILK